MVAHIQIELITTFVINSRAHMNILFIIKVKILALINSLRCNDNTLWYEVSNENASYIDQINH